RKWNAFATDPEWLSARAETEKNGPLISHFSNSIMAPTSYSPMK
ncbi:MAG: NIPSNAP family protein, partial [Burkholderiales bacterium]